MARPTIKKGMSGDKGTTIGEAILLWRSFLGKPELKPAPGTTRYDFGAATEKYTKEWQQSVGLLPNGIVDDRTWAAYDARLATAPKPVQEKAAAVEAVGEAQKAAAMASAVKAKPAAKPAAAKPPTTVPPASGATPMQHAKERVTTQLAAVKNKAVEAKQRVHSMSPLGQAATAGAVALVGLVGYKALKR